MTTRDSYPGQQGTTGAHGTGATPAGGYAPGPGGSGWSNADEGQQGGIRGAAEQAQQTAGQLKDQVQQAAAPMMDQAQQQVGERITSQKDRVADTLASLAVAMRQTGREMRAQDQMFVGQTAERAADRVERLADYLRHREVGEMMDQVEWYARRNSGMFLFGGFTLGLLAARFLKSSAPRPQYRGGYYSGQSPYQTHPYVTQRYGAYGYGTAQTQDSEATYGMATPHATPSPTGQPLYQTGGVTPATSQTPTPTTPTEEFRVSDLDRPASEGATGSTSGTTSGTQPATVGAQQPAGTGSGRTDTSGSQRNPGSPTGSEG